MISSCLDFRSTVRLMVWCWGCPRCPEKGWNELGEQRDMSRRFRRESSGTPSSSHTGDCDCRLHLDSSPPADQTPQEFRQRFQPLRENLSLFHDITPRKGKHPPLHCSTFLQNLTNNQINVIVGQCWKKLPPGEKALYLRMGEEDKLRYLQVKLLH